MRTENQSYIVRNQVDLRRRKIGDRISVGDEGEVGRLIFKGQEAYSPRGGALKVYPKEVPFQIKEGSEKNLVGIAYQNKIKIFPFIN